MQPHPCSIPGGFSEPKHGPSEQQGLVTATRALQGHSGSFSLCQTSMLLYSQTQAKPTEPWRRRSPGEALPTKPFLLQSDAQAERSRTTPVTQKASSAAEPSGIFLLLILAGSSEHLSPLLLLCCGSGCQLLVAHSALLVLTKRASALTSSCQSIRTLLRE